MYSVLHAKEYTRPSVEDAEKPWTSGRGNALEMQIETCRWKQTVRQTVIVTHVVRVMAYLTNCRQPDKLIGLTVRERKGAIESVVSSCGGDNWFSFSFFFSFVFFFFGSLTAAPVKVI